MLVTSKHNPKVKAVIALRDKRNRQTAGLTLVDGYEELMFALNAGVAIKSLFYCPELMSGGEQASKIQSLLAEGLESYELKREVFEKIAYRQGPDGWLAVVPAVSAKLDLIKVKPEILVLVCEAVEKPGNLGAMLRTADAAGADAVIAVDSATDWSNPNIIRASKGAVFSLPVADVSRDELSVWLKTHGIRVVASTPDTKLNYTKTSMTGPIALMVGTEKLGLSDYWLSHADIKVRIPMVGKVNSLNVATSAALLLYEAVRQRS